MSEPKGSEPPFITIFFVSLLFVVVCCAIRIAPHFLCGMLIAYYLYWSINDRRFSRSMRLFGVFFTSGLVFGLVGWPNQPNLGFLTSVFWSRFSTTILWLQHKYNVLLPHGFEYRGISPQEVPLFMAYSLGIGVLVLLFLFTKGKTRSKSLFLFRLWTHLLRLLINPTLLWRKRKQTPGEVYKVNIGVDEHQKPFHLTLDQLNHHVHILGESGFGKTVLLGHMINHHIYNDIGCIVIDLKGDADNLRNLVGHCEKAGRLCDLQVFSCGDPQNSISYNLCRHGNATEIKDKIIGALEWSEPYYKKIAEEIMLLLCSGFVTLRNKRNLQFSLKNLLECLSGPDQCLRLANNLPTSDLTRKTLFDLAHRLETKAFVHDLAGIKSDLALLLHSDFGHLFSNTKNGLDLFASIQEQKIVYIGLDALKFGESAIRIGKMILQDLKTVSSRIMREIPAHSRSHFTLFIDEFAELASLQFSSFIRMARGSKIGIVMAHQEFADLNAVSLDFRDQVVGNAATTISFLQKNPESAELMASLAGTFKTTKLTKQVDDGLLFRTYTGVQSEREVEEFLIHPNEIKNLQVGECFVISKYPSAEVARVRVHRSETPPLDSCYSQNALHEESRQSAAELVLVPGPTPTNTSNNPNNADQISELF